MRFSRPINDQSPRVTGGFSTSHKGVDYGYPDGTPIYASQAGRVTIAKGNETRQWIANTKSDPYKPASGTRALKTEDYGNFIKIDHGSGYTTLYAHLKHQSLNVRVGDTVGQGQKIAEVGSTGNSTGNHLHWEIRQNERSINPSPILDPGFDKYGGEVSPPVADKKTVQVEADVFEKLVHNSSKYDQFFDAGYSDVRVVTRRINELQKDVGEKQTKIEELSSRLEEALKQKPEPVSPPTGSNEGTVSDTSTGEAVQYDFSQEYAYWKKLVWRFGRTAVATGIAAAAVVAPSVQIDPTNPLPYAVAVGSAFFAGFINATGKAIRDHFNDGDMTAKSQKLPI